MQRGRSRDRWCARETHQSPICGSVWVSTAECLDSVWPSVQRCSITDLQPYSAPFQKFLSVQVGAQFTVVPAGLLAGHWSQANLTRTCRNSPEIGFYFDTLSVHTLPGKQSHVLVNRGCAFHTATAYLGHAWVLSKLGTVVEEPAGHSRRLVDTRPLKFMVHQEQLFCESASFSRGSSMYCSCARLVVSTAFFARALAPTEEMVG